LVRIQKQHFTPSLVLLPPSRRLRSLVSLFVCLQDYEKITQPTFAKFGRRVINGSRKKPDFGGKPDHVMLVRVRFRIRVW